ncbi:MAG: hypothetical protein HKN12_02105 [Gemmatimonadetes bacterium]|nr:hypothetical protein [Gemmatimonadota bacterium]
MNVVNQALERSLVNFPLESGASVVVRPSQTHESIRVVSEVIADNLRARGFTVEVQDPEPEITDEMPEQARIALEEQGVGIHPEDPLLSYEVLASSYEIVRARRARYVGPRSIERVAEIDLDLTLTVKGEEAPRWTSSARGRDTESVIASRVPKSAGYPRGGGTGPQTGQRHPLVEPAIVGGLVTGLAVIFFSNRNVGE